MNHKLLNTLKIPVRWMDLDAYSHVNNSKYFDYMTEARAGLLGEIIKKSDLCQFILVDTHCNFKKPYFYLDTIILEQFSENIGNSSFSLYYRFSKEEADGIYAEGTAKLVCFDPINKRVMRVPTIIKNLLDVE